VRPDRESLARRVSPQTYVRPDLPPILTVHGENDPLVPYQQVRKDQFLTMQPEGVAKAHEAGVIIAAGSDVGSGLMYHGLSTLEPIAYVELAGMSEMDAIVTATVNGAKLLRREDELGTLEAGKFADLIATGTSPLENIRALLDVTFVMKGGVVYRNDE